MENSNETAVVGLVPRAVALALAFFATTAITATVAFAFTPPGEKAGLNIAGAAFAPIETVIKVVAR